MTSYTFSTLPTGLKKGTEIKLYDRSVIIFELNSDGSVKTVKLGDHIGIEFSDNTEPKWRLFLDDNINVFIELITKIHKKGHKIPDILRFISTPSTMPTDVLRMIIAPEVIEYKKIIDSRHLQWYAKSTGYLTRIDDNNDLFEETLYE